jgi:hypothetical protein
MASRTARRCSALWCRPLPPSRLPFFPAAPHKARATAEWRHDDDHGVTNARGDLGGAQGCWGQDGRSRRSHVAVVDDQKWPGRRSSGRLYTPLNRLNATARHSSEASKPRRSIHLSVACSLARSRRAPSPAASFTRPIPDCATRTGTRKRIHEMRSTTRTPVHHSRAVARTATPPPRLSSAQRRGLRYVRPATPRRGLRPPSVTPRRALRRAGSRAALGADKLGSRS